MLREYIYDDKFQIWIINNTISILNYIEIISFSDTKVIIKCPNNMLCINGNNLTISKLLKDELEILGRIINIEFR